MGIAADDEDEQHENHLLAAAVIDVGDRGYAHAEPYHADLEAWEDAICPQVDKQRYLRSGFGFVIRLGELAIAEEEDRIHQAQLDAMAAQADAGIPDADFDKFLASLK
ncbi:MAG TPA: hypothetical protein VHB51_04235 [Candidatus Saccharimonadales bacterium]|nr:hypothetical protein [Candidatus Saccharimonadales bacterium]